jgi:DtxR family Mn-dependent transcriptional regulator
MEQTKGGSHHDLSPAMQDYLKALYKLEQKAIPLTNSALAEELSLTAASVSGMMKKLAEKDCVSYSPYREIELTEKGRQISLELIRHHRIIELFLVNVLGMSWDQVHEEAERLEHVISEELEEAMARVLDYPKFDPHGHPIPGLDGTIEDRPALKMLLQIPEDTEAVVREVSDSDPEALRFLDEQGIRPGARLLLISIQPFEGPYELEVGGRRVLLSRLLCGRVRVEPV